jgi:hypothetical protein
MSEAVLKKKKLMSEAGRATVRGCQGGGVVGPLRKWPVRGSPSQASHLVAADGYGSGPLGRWMGSWAVVVRTANLRHFPIG